MTFLMVELAKGMWWYFKTPVSPGGFVNGAGLFLPCFEMKNGNGHAESVPNEMTQSLQSCTGAAFNALGLLLPCDRLLPGADGGAPPPC